MKTLINQKVYVCDFCGRKSVNAGGMNRHEFNCRNNPENWTACGGCKYLETFTKEIDRCNDDEYNTYTSKHTAFKCLLSGVNMYPSVLVRRGIIKKYPSQFKGEIQMPNVCKNFDETEII